MMRLSNSRYVSASTATVSELVVEMATRVSLVGACRITSGVLSTSTHTVLARPSRRRPLVRNRGPLSPFEVWHRRSGCGLFSVTTRLATFGNPRSIGEVSGVALQLRLDGDLRMGCVVEI